MEVVLADIKEVVVYQDDILMTGMTEEEHLLYLEKVLSKLSNAGLKLKKEKCFSNTISDLPRTSD